MKVFRWIVFVTCVVWSCSDTPEVPLEETDLFRFEVGANYLRPVDDQWVFISDQDGISSAAFALTNETTIKIPTTGLTGDRFSFHIVTAAPATEFEMKTYRILSFTDVTPDAYKLLPSVLGGSMEGVDSRHKCEIINDVFPEYSDEFAGAFGPEVKGYGSYSKPDPNGMTCEPKFRGTQTDITYYASFAEGDCRYKTIRNAADGGVASIKYSEMTPFENSTTYSFNKPLKAFCIGSGFNDGETEDHILTVNIALSRLANQVTYYYPNVQYDHYAMTMQTENEDGTEQGWMTYIGDKLPAPFTYPGKRSIHVELDQRKLVTTLSEKASMTHLVSDEEQTLNGEQILLSWNVYAPGDLERHITLPVLPEVLTQQHPALNSVAQEFNVVATLDMDGEDGYHDLIDSQYKPDEDAAVWGLGYVYGRTVFKLYTDLRLTGDDGGRKQPWQDHWMGNGMLDVVSGV